MRGASIEVTPWFQQAMLTTPGLTIERKGKPHAHFNGMRLAKDGGAAVLELTNDDRVIARIRVPGGSVARITDVEGFIGLRMME